MSRRRAYSLVPRAVTALRGASAARASSSMAHARLPPGVKLPPDVDPLTGECGGGYVSIRESAGKGLGAFAARAMAPDHVVGLYKGELLSLSGYHARYGDANGQLADAEWHGRWSAARERRGVGVSGQYVFKLSVDEGEPPMFLDAEDPAVANWTRYINHSDDPNLATRPLRGAGAPAAAVAGVRFVVQKHIAPGAELTFFYGLGFARWIQRHCGGVALAPEQLYDGWVAY